MISDHVMTTTVIIPLKIKSCFDKRIRNNKHNIACKDNNKYNIACKDSFSITVDSVEIWLNIFIRFSFFLIIYNFLYVKFLSYIETKLPKKNGVNNLFKNDYLKWANFLFKNE